MKNWLKALTRISLWYEVILRTFLKNLGRYDPVAVHVERLGQMRYVVFELE
ncbi:hypothetical protein IID10_21165 [candidate division KSB1 bacterium]|nr:hypothetical protein [candidate division KSB1 bacterium]